MRKTMSMSPTATVVLVAVLTAISLHRADTVVRAEQATSFRLKCTNPHYVAQVAGAPGPGIGPCRSSERAARRDARRHWRRTHNDGQSPFWQQKSHADNVAVYQFAGPRCRDEGEPIWRVDEDCTQCPSRP